MKYLLTLALSIMLWLALPAQDVMMQAWYWDYPKVAAGYNWADTLAGKATQLANAGFTHVWFPPHTVASFGTGSNGYDPQDLFIGNQTTGFGTRASLDACMAALSNAGIDPVADMIYNHRDGGRAENNPAVEGWIENYTTTKVNQGDAPYPSDRYRMVLPIGGTTGLGTGDYYLKLKSASGHSNFHNFGYKIYLQTNAKGYNNQPPVNEVEPNAGAGCGEASDNISIGQDLLGNIDAMGCGVDEFKLTLNSGDFFASSDSLFITVTNTGGYSDHYFYEIWYNGTNVQPQLLFQTYTDFSGLPSGRGDMDYTSFKPNGNPTSLSGDKEGMWFFYDYDQTYSQPTIDTLIEWTKWNYDALSVRGLRLDAVKHFDGAFVGNMLDAMVGSGRTPSMVVGELFTTNLGEYSNWLTEVYTAMDATTAAAVDVRVFDFSLRDNLRQACDDTGFDVRNIYVGSAVDNGFGAYNVVTFANNHDFREGSGYNALIQNDVELAYAYLLTNNQIGIPTVFYPDYYGYPTGALSESYHPSDKAPRRSQIDSLMVTHTNHIFGASDRKYLNKAGSGYAITYQSAVTSKVLIYQLDNPSTGASVLVAINFDQVPLSANVTIDGLNGTVHAGDVFNRLNGTTNTASMAVNSGLTVDLQVPARSYAVWLQSAILPVAITQFSATPLREKAIQLDWKTASEVNLKHYDIQRSVNGIHFESIGLKAPKTDRQYSFIDDQIDANQTYYYRLRVLDHDHTQSYSAIKTARWTIQSNSDLRLTVFPNPTLKQRNLQVTWDAAIRSFDQVSVFDISQKRIFHQRLHDHQQGQLVVPITHLPQGTYQLQLGQGASLISTTFIKS